MFLRQVATEFFQPSKGELRFGLAGGIRKFPRLDSRGRSKGMLLHFVLAKNVKDAVAFRFEIIGN